ncbi:MAG: N-acetylmuramoyl-L-alanine amidase family protein, partial [Bacillota bacterium]
ESELSANKRQMRVVLKDSPVVNKTFIIDPGHGGQDNGASGKKGTLEKELNLEVSLRLKDLLEEAGAKVVLTRLDDTFISLYERAFLANFLMADFFISVHTNSHPKIQTEGIEVFYYPNHSHARPLATNILDAMVRETGLKKLTVKTNNFAVIRETQMPGVLLELGFLSNPQEELTLSSDEFKNNAAQGIFRGIIDFLE